MGNTWLTPQALPKTVKIYSHVISQKLLVTITQENSRWSAASLFSQEAQAWVTLHSNSLIKKDSKTQSSDPWLWLPHQVSPLASSLVIPLGHCRPEPTYNYWTQGHGGPQPLKILNTVNINKLFFENAMKI